MKSNSFIFRTSPAVVALLVMSTLLSCKKQHQTPYQSQTVLLAGKHWDLVTVTARDIDGSPVPITPDTLDYSMDNYYVYSNDGL